MVRNLLRFAAIYAAALLAIGVLVSCQSAPMDVRPPIARTP